MTKNKKIGLILVIGPICLLIFILVAYAIATFVTSAIIAGNEANVNVNTNAVPGLAEESLPNTVMNVIRVGLGLLGIIAVLGIIVGVPFGIYFLAKKEGPEILARLKAKPEFASLPDDQLLYISNVSWGAFFGTGIWALGNKLYLWALPYILVIIIGFINSAIVYLSFSQPERLQSYSSLLSLLGIISIPLGIATLAVWLYLFIKGRQIAWLKGWQDFNQFKNRQKLMAWIILAVIIVMTVFEFGLNMIMMNKSTLLMENQPQLNLQECITNCMGDDTSVQNIRNCQNLCQTSQPEE